VTTYDANGVARYESTDPPSPVHDLLNVGMESVSSAIDVLRNQLTNAPGVIATVPRANWLTSVSYPIPTLVDMNGIVILTSGLFISAIAQSFAAGAAIVVADVDAGGVPGPLLPIQEVYGSGTIFAGSAVPVPCYVSVSSVGAITVVPDRAVTFAAGGATNTIRVHGIPWLKP
jgi:hypothetical protein